MSAQTALVRGQAVCSHAAVSLRPTSVRCHVRGPSRFVSPGAKANLPGSRVLIADSHRLATSRESRRAALGAHVICVAAADAVTLESPPESKEQAFAQARTAIEYVVAQSKNTASSGIVGGGKKKKKQKAKIAGKRVALEIPLMDESPKELATLTAELLKNLTGNLVVYFGTAPYAAAATAGGCKGELRDLSVTGNMETVPAATDLLVFVGVQATQIGALRTVAMRAPSCPVVLVNAEWDPSAVPKGERSFVDTFEVIYSHTPLAIQGFLKNTEGAVFRCVTSGSAGDAPWCIYWGGECIKQERARPSPVGLEQLLYNKAAEDSALVKAADAFAKARDTLNPFAKKQ
mmetsp:Transcript_36903/g.80381  ORF Transcript_36903/g.80381 Transcript_36903/m.80381 type:complete len:347 (-) Transcript_36903:1567-2607(-)|eukprot:CAMPEP_0118924574 /NCGR_PEP_ID=MMETSP1169-20130426/2648_1 /TAXON_ID=36882 /ORGANISM="Pyramimonas obovata, Strain CCMP722" /LENGTH=346 /DNA_ID=CAMNT_0006865701 /DNA_START=95 /DNA_END=1135 /DNA_ORIENTATION=+